MALWKSTPARIGGWRTCRVGNWLPPGASAAEGAAGGAAAGSGAAAGGRIATGGPSAGAGAAASRAPCAERPGADAGGAASGSDPAVGTARSICSPVTWLKRYTCCGPTSKCCTHGASQSLACSTCCGTVRPDPSLSHSLDQWVREQMWSCEPRVMSLPQTLQVQSHRCVSLARVTSRRSAAGSMNCLQAGAVLSAAKYPSRPGRLLDGGAAAPGCCPGAGCACGGCPGCAGGCAGRGRPDSWLGSAGPCCRGGAGCPAPWAGEQNPRRPVTWLK
mmetsp:Transcript_20246/g.63651  ORF Transcript_20246/g.63651 Transcript_20246/m.63651 type:complete len:275 (+) Transcript_20246:427-1251(+)